MVLPHAIQLTGDHALYFVREGIDFWQETWPLQQKPRISPLQITFDSPRDHMDANRRNIKFLSVTQESFPSNAGKHEQISAARSFVASRMHAQRRALADHTTRNLCGRNTKPWVHSAPRADHENRARQVVLADTHLELYADMTTSSAELSEELSLNHLIEIFQPSEPEMLSSILEDTDTSTDGTMLNRSPVNHQWHKYSLTCIENIALEDEGRRRPAVRGYRTKSEPGSSTTTTEAPPGSQVRRNQYSHGALQHHVSGPVFETSAIAEVRSVLDPFVRLPIVISTEERSLIHFYLDFGRRWLLGTSSNPKHCPALKLARLQMENSPIYVFSHVVVGELILSRVCNRPLRRCYYMRCADMYQAANRVLSDDTVSASSKLYVLIQLSMVEHLARRIDLKAMHLKAIQYFVESEGGIEAVLGNENSGELERLLTRFYANQFVLTELSIEDYGHFLALKCELLKSMDIVQKRTSILCRHSVFTQDHRNEKFVTGGYYELKPLTNYLHNLLSKWRQYEVLATAFLDNAGVLCCSYSLAMTLVECNPIPEVAFKFLFLVQKCVSESTPLSRQAGKELDNIHPVAVTDIISCIRCEVFPDNGNSRELRITQALVTAHKMCALLSSVRKIEMVAWVVDNILPMDPHDRKSTAFDESYLKLLDEDLDRAWWASARSTRD